MIDVGASGRLAGELVTSTSETAAGRRIAAQTSSGNAEVEVTAARWRYRGVVSYMTAETTGSGGLEGGSVVVEGGEPLAPGARLSWRAKRRVGSLRTTMATPSGPQVLEGPVYNDLEPITFTVTDVTATSIVGTVDATPLARYETSLGGEPTVEVAGHFELRRSDR